jgi:hypothetical protein
MRLLQAVLGSVVLVLGTAGGCGGGSGTGSSGTGGSGAKTATACIDLGQPCYSNPGGCCGGIACVEGSCGPCNMATYYTQCQCNGMNVGPLNGCKMGASCGLDVGAPDGGDGDGGDGDGGDGDGGDGGASGVADGGACQCVQVIQYSPCG